MVTWEREVSLAALAWRCHASMRAQRPDAQRPDAWRFAACLAAPKFTPGKTFYIGGKAFQVKHVTDEMTHMDNPTGMVYVYTPFADEPGAPGFEDPSKLGRRVVVGDMVDFTGQYTAPPMKTAADVTDEPTDDEDDDDEAADPPDPSSPLYTAKIAYWTKKMEVAQAKGRSHKVEHYRRLLVMYPPLPNGHAILSAYIDALKAEYQDGQSGIVKMWLDSTSEEEYTKVGTTKDRFDQWQDTSEDAVKNKLISLGELKRAWGPFGEKDAVKRVIKKQPSQVKFPAPEPVAPSYQQQTPAWQPATQQMQCTVPPGAYGGMTIQVNTPSGRMNVTVPAGLSPGMQFTFNVPTQPAAPAPAFQPTQVVVQHQVVQQQLYGGVQGYGGGIQHYGGGGIYGGNGAAAAGLGAAVGFGIGMALAGR